MSNLIEITCCIAAGLFFLWLFIKAIRDQDPVIYEHLCHRCGSGLYKITAVQKMTLVNQTVTATPEGATHYCPKCRPVIYYQMITLNKERQEEV